jgi:hypothetical protein
MDDPKERLLSAGSAITTAVMMLRHEQETFEAFLKECRDMENFGHIVDPTLFMNPERSAASALMRPLFEAAIAFIRAHDEQVTRARAALTKVKA